MRKYRRFVGNPEEWSAGESNLDVRNAVPAAFFDAAREASPWSFGRLGKRRPNILVTDPSCDVA